MPSANPAIDFENDGADQRQQEFLRSLGSSYRSIYGCIFTLVANRPDAEDVFQETAVVLWRKYVEEGPPLNFTAWACSVARNVVRGYLRREGRRRGKASLSDAHLAMLATVHGGSTELLELRQEVLRTCLEQLPDQDRSLLLKCYGEAGGVNDLARRTGRSPEALYSKLKRLRHRLFDCVTRKMAGG